MEIYVLLKDKIVLESELEKQNIEYYCEIENQPMFENGIRYLIFEDDREKIDKIFRENEIIAETETIQVSDYRDDKKAMEIYLKIAGTVFVIMILIIIIEKIIK